MWNGMFSPQVNKSAGFEYGGQIAHEERGHTVEVVEVLDGFARVVVHFNHWDSDATTGKEWPMPSNDTGYEYEYEVEAGMDEVDVQKELEELSLTELLQTLDTIDPDFRI
jgi:hypothetical protein